MLRFSCDQAGSIPVFFSWVVQKGANGSFADVSRSVDGETRRSDGIVDGLLYQ